MGATPEKKGLDRWLPRALRGRIVGLPTRIIMAVFSAALVTGIAVTLTSTRSTEEFLRSKIDERFPELLLATANGLEHWYAQRELDMATFASSAIVIRGAASGGSAARSEAQRYLDYVLEGFPQYRALWLLGLNGESRISVGQDLSIAEARLQELAALEQSTVGPFFLADGESYQLISTPVERSGTRIGTLHVLVAAESLVAMLSPGEAVDSGIGIYLVGDDREVLLASDGAPKRDRFERTVPRLRAQPSVSDYVDPGGVHVVGSSMRLGRGGWILAIEQDYDVAFAPVVRVVSEVMAINLGIVLTFCLIASFIARSIVQPIHGLSDRARQIAQGDTDVEIIQSDRSDEIGVLSRALHEMVARLKRSQAEVQRNKEALERTNGELTEANEELSRNNEVLEQLSFTDGLTRLHNHRYFQDRLRLESKRSDRNEEPLALLILDLDDFKALNDNHGHAAGDEVLRRVGTIINAAVRETDLPARYGGEEFAVLAPRTDVEGAATLGEKLRASISSARIRCAGHDEVVELSVTVSVGVALYSGDSRKLFVQADRALYGAKDQGKDCVVVFEEGETT